MIVKENEFHDKVILDDSWNQTICQNKVSLEKWLTNLVA